MSNYSVLYNSVLEICEEENINLVPVSDKWILRLEKNGQVEYIAGFKFPNNNYASADICNDKVATFELLNSFDIECVRHIPIFAKDYTNFNDEYFNDILKLGNGIVFVKENRGTCGKNIYVCKNLFEVKSALSKLFEFSYMAAISPKVSINVEYRIIVLNGEVQVIYGKKIKEVFGNGILTVEELCIEKSIDTENLEEDIKNIVLEKDEKIKLSNFHNLTKFGDFFEVYDSSVKKELSDLAITVADVIKINFCSVDIVEYNGEFKVLEVNSGVMAETYGKELNYQKVKAVYKKAICSLFS